MSKLNATGVRPLLVTVSLFALAGTAVAAPSATTTPRDMYYADATPDISGFWRPEQSPGASPWLVGGKPLAHRDEGGAWIGLPYTPAYSDAYEKRRASNIAGKPYGEPHFDCWPRGMMHAYIGGVSTMTITQTPGRIEQIFEEDTQIRDIYSDGRAMPKAADPAAVDYAPKMSGYSIAHWEGQTLVVETRGVRKELTFGFLAPHSDVTRFTERLTRIDRDHLAIAIHIEDAKALDRPIEMQLTYKRDPSGVFADNFCVENNRNSTDQNRFLTTQTSSKRPMGWDLPDD